MEWILSQGGKTLQNKKEKEKNLWNIIPKTIHVYHL
jgi:hypothetical protein